MIKRDPQLSMTDQTTEFLLYKTPNDDIKVEVFLRDENLWLTQNRITQLFGVSKSTISEHLKNIFESGELQKESTVRNFRTVRKEGNRNVARSLEFYNLDTIIAAGYRVNSKKATQFRIWATKTLKQHIIQGFTVNANRLKQNHKVFLETVHNLKSLVGTNKNIHSKDILELITIFSPTWFSLDCYDKNTFPKQGTQKEISITAEDLQKDLAHLKRELINKKEATSLFAQEKKQGNLKGIVGSVFQTVFGADAYPTIEQKAAHLLYFIIKNHPFNDGNKRSAAFAFIWFLRKANFSFEHKITPQTLATLTILIAESNPADKEKMIGIILLLLQLKK